MPKARDLASRYWEKVDVKEDNECWLWLGSCNPDGYGNFRLGSRTDNTRRVVNSHRVGYQLWNNKTLTSYIKVLHTCDNPPCQNPHHLFEGTDADNARDKQAKGRGIGKQDPSKKSHLSKDDVDNIRREYSSLGGNLSRLPNGAVQHFLDKYDISRSTLNNIANHTTWRHYAPPD